MWARSREFLTIRSCSSVPRIEVVEVASAHIPGWTCEGYKEVSRKDVLSIVGIDEHVGEGGSPCSRRIEHGGSSPSSWPIRSLIAVLCFCPRCHRLRSIVLTEA